MLLMKGTIPEAQLKFEVSKFYESYELQCRYDDGGVNFFVSPELDTVLSELKSLIEPKVATA